VTESESAFYSVCGRDFFPGLVALLNSLRLNGHLEPLFVLDCGMEPRQRELLAPHATILPAPDDVPPSLLKLVAPMAHPARAMALLDADVIVIRPLTELIDRAAAGTVVGFENDLHRFFEEWAELLDLGSLRRGPYLTSSSLFLAGELAARLLPLAHGRQLRVDRRPTWLGKGPESHPLYYMDQDVLNAVLLARLGQDRVIALDQRLSATPPFSGLRVTDETVLRCQYDDGTEPYLLHHFFRKPWLVPMRSNPYSRLMTRLLLGDDVPLRLSESELPLRLRTGRLARLERLRVDVLVGAPAYVRRRLTRRPSRITAWEDAPPSHAPTRRERSR
jgi:hypothetical protein